MKSLYRITIIIGIILLIILVFSCVKVITSDAPQIDKTNTIIQGIYTIVTTILVMLTFSVLMVSKEQSNQLVRPDLELGEVDLIDDRRNEFDFEIYNTGKGTAYNILIKIYKKNEDKPFYQKKYSRLGVIQSELLSPLYGILNELEDIKSKMANSSGITRTINEDISIYEELQLADPYSNYYDINFVIEFEDQFSNQYLNKFELLYDTSESDYNLISESTNKNDNFILMFKKAFRKKS